MASTQTVSTTPVQSSKPAKSNGDKKLSKNEKKALFEEYSAIKAELDGLDDRKADLREQLSAVVKQIFHGAGKGPFEYKGERLTAVHRKVKGNPEAEGTYFFKTFEMAAEKIG